MTASASAPVHRRARWVRPWVYAATMSQPLRRPRVTVLRSSCGHVLGVGLVWRRQQYAAWKRCAR